MYIAHSSIVTAIGNDSKSVYFAQRASLSQVRESQFYNARFDPIKMALVPTAALKSASPELRSAYPDLSSRELRLLSLCGGAISDDLLERIGDDKVTLLLAGPESLPSAPAAQTSLNFLKAVIDHTGLNVDKKKCRLFSLGRPGAIVALDHAYRLMSETETRTVLVIGVDSYWDYNLLAWLDAQDRLLAYGVLDGFAPGEGASCLLISKSEPPMLPDRKQVKLYPPGLGEEEGHLYGKGNYLGEGLSKAVEIATKAIPDDSISTIYSSMNGENFWAKELGLAQTRNYRKFTSEINVQHPSDCFGDIGAAFPTAVLTMLTHQAEGHYLIYGSADGATRASIIANVY